MTQQQELPTESLIATRGYVLSPSFLYYLMDKHQSVKSHAGMNRQLCHGLPNSQTEFSSHVSFCYHSTSEQLLM